MRLGSWTVSLISAIAASNDSPSSAAMAFGSLLLVDALARYTQPNLSSMKTAKLVNP